MDSKICNKCNRELPIEQFELEHTKKYGDRRRGTCRECRAKYRQKWRKKILAYLMLKLKDTKIDKVSGLKK